MKNKLLWLFLTFNITSCGTIKIHDTEVCTVAGVLSAGVNCTKVVSGDKRELTFEELIEMLEPSEAHGPAVIIPLKDFIKLKEQLEQACVHLRCKKEVKKKLNLLVRNLNFISGGRASESSLIDPTIEIEGIDLDENSTIQEIQVEK